MKKIVSVQDLSCLGKCSLTVALPVLSAMGCACTPLPTAVLSTHTAFPAPHIRSLTEDMESMIRHWQSIGAKFDAISVGYLSDPRQAETILHLVQAFPATVILDPVLGDHGKLYAGITPEHVVALRQLCRQADVLLPNLTEAAALTGIPYQEQGDEAYYKQLLDALLSMGAKSVVLTGVSLAENTTGFMTSQAQLYQTRKLLGSFHGTGDLFAATFTGGLLQGKALFDAAALAAGFVEKVIAGQTPTPFGVEFESHLPWLWEQL